jgi:hypothetical protein
MKSDCTLAQRSPSRALADEIVDGPNLGDLTEAILATVSVIHGELLGEPSAELRAKLAGSEFPHLFMPYQSM